MDTTKNEFRQLLTNNLLIMLQNSHNRSTIKLFADTCINFGCINVIFSKITTSAASIGTPESQKAIIICYFLVKQIADQIMKRLNN